MINIDSIFTWVASLGKLGLPNVRIAEQGSLNNKKN